MVHQKILDRSQLFHHHVHLIPVSYTHLDVYKRQIKERFYMDLEFGTAGLRGIIGAGINRMNIYTVRRATQGLANYIIKQGGAAKGVAIAFDSRHMLSLIHI